MVLASSGQYDYPTEVFRQLSAELSTDLCTCITTRLGPRLSLKAVTPLNVRGKYAVLTQAPRTALLLANVLRRERGRGREGERGGERGRGREGREGGEREGGERGGRERGERGGGEGGERGGRGGGRGGGGGREGGERERDHFLSPTYR